MKVRIITGVISALFAITLLVFTGLGFSGPMGVAISAFSVIAAYELMRVSKCKNKLMTVCSMVFAGLVPFYADFGLKKYIPIPASVLIICYVIAMLIIMLKYYDITKFEHTTLALFGSIAVPCSLSLIFEVRNLSVEFPQYFQRSHCVFFILCAMYAAWLSDTFAYFIGSKFGKRKLAPKISPKKSIEGAVAGVVGTTVVAVITYFICDHFYFRLDTVNVWMVIFSMLFLTVLGMCGDLSASVIKRNYGEKDFGNLFPGHGGVLDRIDSFLFTMPGMYVILQIGIAIAGK